MKCSSSVVPLVRSYHGAESPNSERSGRVETMRSDDIYQSREGSKGVLDGSGTVCS